MKSNTKFHQLTWCPFSLHKTQIDPVATPAEAVGFWHGYHKISTVTDVRGYEPHPTESEYGLESISVDGD